MFPLILLVLLSLMSCERHRPINVPGLSDFEAELKDEYEYVSRIKCILNNPTCYTVRCKLTKHVIPEKMPDLIALLKEYALTDVFETQCGPNRDNVQIVFLDFYVGTSYYFGYRYYMGGYDEPVWEIE